MVLRTVSLGLRAFQFIAATVVVGLSATVASDWKLGNVPPTLGYSVFTGAAGMIVAVLSAAGLFLSFIPELVPLVLDTGMGILILCGGIAWAAGLKDIRCTDKAPETCIDMVRNKLINEGCEMKDNEYYCPGYNGDTDAICSHLRSVCQKEQVAEIFQFIAFAFFAALVGVGWFMIRRGGGGYRSRGRVVV